MKFDYSYNIETQLPEFTCYFFDKNGKEKCSHVTGSVKRNQHDTYIDLVNWLNQCCRAYDKETPSQ